MGGIRFTPHRHFERTLNVIYCCASKDWAAVSYRLNDAVCDRRGDDGAVVPHRHVLLACAQLGCPAEYIRCKRLLFFLRAVLQFVRYTVVLQTTGAFLARNRFIDRPDLLFSRVKLRCFLSRHGAGFHVGGVHEIIHLLLQLRPLLKQCF